MEPVAAHAAPAGRSEGEDDNMFEPLTLSPRTCQAFWRWARCFCVYVFDVEMGQKLELEMPAGGRPRAPIAARLLGYLAFPDSGPSRGHSATAGGREAETAIFGLRFRRDSGAARGQRRGPGAGAGVGAPSSGDFSYGVACFRQQPDATRPRHCVQRSIVIVSQHGLVSFFSKAMRHVG
ncbi:unnamed protein product, partial [Prorocentrum cordatum]